MPNRSKFTLEETPLVSDAGVELGGQLEIVQVDVLDSLVQLCNTFIVGLIDGG